MRPVRHRCSGCTSKVRCCRPPHAVRTRWSISWPRPHATRRARRPEHGVRLVTVAPELPGARALVAQLAFGGVAVALGHSDADADDFLAGFDAGAVMCTHLFNAMPTVPPSRSGPRRRRARDTRSQWPGGRVDLRRPPRRPGGGGHGVARAAPGTSGAATSGRHCGTTTNRHARRPGRSPAASSRSMPPSQPRRMAGASVAEATGCVTSRRRGSTRPHRPRA